MKKNAEEWMVKIMEIKCAACGKPVMVDKRGQGSCPYCNWYQSKSDFTDYNVILDPNLVSLTRARQLVVEHKEIKPTFEEFIEAYEDWGEMQFDYLGHHYGIVTFNGINLYEKNVKGSTSTYQNVQDFREHAHIDGNLLKDIWEKIEDADYM